MLMVQVGDDVKHPEFGVGKVVGLIGHDKDDGVRMRLADGRVKRVMFTNDDPAQSKWRKIKTGRKAAESLVSKLIED